MHQNEYLLWAILVGQMLTIFAVWPRKKDNFSEEDKSLEDAIKKTQQEIDKIKE